MWCERDESSSTAVQCQWTALRERPWSWRRIGGSFLSCWSKLLRTHFCQCTCHLICAHALHALFFFLKLLCTVCILWMEALAVLFSFFLISVKSRDNETAFWVRSFFKSPVPVGEDLYFSARILEKESTVHDLLFCVEVWEWEKEITL